MKVLAKIVISLTLIAASNLFADTTGLPPAGPNPIPTSGPSPAPVPGALAEIQIFYGYQGYDNYAWKTVSTQYRPLSIDFILRGYQTAACYKGDPIAALDLFATMVNIYNYENSRAIRFVADNFYYYADGKGALQIATTDEWGNPFLDFPRMIECDRW